MKKAFLFLGVIAVAAAAGGTTAWALAERTEGQALTYVDREVAHEPVAGTHFTSYQAEQYPDLTYAAENAVQAVVNIEVVQRVEMPRSGYGYDPFLDPFREFSDFPSSAEVRAMTNRVIKSGAAAVRASSCRPTATSSPTTTWPMERPPCA